MKYPELFVNENTKLSLYIEELYFFLRPLREHDVTSKYASWLNDIESTRYLETPAGNTTIDSLASYVSSHNVRIDSLLLGIFVKPSGNHVGNIKLEPISFFHKKAVVGMLIGDPDYRSKGLGSAVIHRLLQFAFDELGLHRIELGVTADNHSAIKCYERVGFVLEGRLRDATWRKNRYVDNLYYAILNEDFARQKLHAYNPA